jgi:hypothetical protein
MTGRTNGPALHNAHTLLISFDIGGAKATQTGPEHKYDNSDGEIQYKYHVDSYV